jgi:hypothetical protein
MVGGDEGVTLFSMTSVELGDPIDSDVGLCLTDTSGGLEPAHRFPKRGVDQPVAGGHRRPVEEEREVDDDRRRTRFGTDHHVEPTSRLTPDEFSHGEKVGVVVRPALSMRSA